MDDSNLMNQISTEVRTILEGAEGGHDWWHVHRVYQTAIALGRQEKADLQVVGLAALLHDIADAKFNDGDETIGPELAQTIMQKHGINYDNQTHVTNIIKHMSFKNTFDRQEWSSLEMQVVQDADKLDAIGAIGIARAFSYGGFKKRLFFDPEIPPVLYPSKEAYKKSTAPTINHFYEKLLLLKDMMHTKSGRAQAEQRHQYMVTFLEQFYSEFGVDPNWEVQKIK